VLLLPAGIGWMAPPVFSDPPVGLYAWPFWWPLPGWFGDGGDWRTGLAVALAGAAAGAIILRVVRTIFSTGLGIEALGLGDADLMMMAGAFLGWQPVVVAFFIAPLPALVFALVLRLGWGEEAIPFGPSLGLALMLTCLHWTTFGPAIQILAWNGPFLLLLAGAGAVLMFVSGVVARLFRWLRGS
jgi:leader peptidase (prepilin peptidase)/N-methyltransferase